MLSTKKTSAPAADTKQEIPDFATDNEAKAYADAKFGPQPNTIQKPNTTAEVFHSNKRYTMLAGTSHKSPVKSGTGKLSGSRGRVYTASTSSMAATNALLAFGGMTHCCFRCGLRMFF